MARLLKQLEDKYEILERLREDETGAIYKVRHRLLGEVRVIQVINPRPGQLGETRERVMEEARAAIRLEHPHDPRIVDCIVDDGCVAYVVMEHGPGGAGGEPAADSPADAEVETVFLRPPAAAAESPAGSSDATTRMRPAVTGASAPEDAALEDTVILIRRLRDDGRAGEALEELNRAVRELGPRPELKTLRYELGEALLERDAEEEDTASRMFEAATALAVAGPASVPAPHAPPTASSPPEPPPPEPAAPAVFDPTIRSAPAIPPAPERPGPPVAHSNRSLVAVGLVLAAVFALLVWVLVRRDPDRRKPIATENVPADLTPGSLVIDAVPWAEIVRLERPGSQEQPSAPPSRFTPVILRLPPGDYRVILRYPPTGEEQERGVRVDSDVRLDQRFTFEDVDGHEYFERIGW